MENMNNIANALVKFFICQWHVWQSSSGTVVTSVLYVDSTDHDDIVCHGAYNGSDATGTYVAPWYIFRFYHYGLDAPTRVSIQLIDFVTEVTPC